MKFIKILSFVCFAVVLMSQAAFSQDRKAEVIDFVEKAVAHYKAVGKEQALKDFANKGGDFMKGELYIVVEDTDGVILLHPLNSKLNGKKMIKLKDTDGKLFVKEMADMAKNNSKGWVSYKWVHPQTKKIAQKHTYVSLVDDKVYLLAGYYE